MQFLKRFLPCMTLFAVIIGFSSYAQGNQTSAPTQTEQAKSAVAAAPDDEQFNKSLVETISFRFDISSLMTNHQFEGQLNTFHVEYEYSGRLSGGGFDPKGHKVRASDFPYFQSVRNDIIKFAMEYPDKTDFYEIFGENICRFILRQYPQIRRITLSIDIPAYKSVDVDRSATVVLARRATRIKK